jgi:hypothetical protein
MSGSGTHDLMPAAHGFAGVDIVGIDFSTSIQRLALHVIRNWDRYRHQTDALRGDHGVWAFGVNALPFPLTHRPVSPWLLPSFSVEHFQRREYDRGLIQYGSAFYDYFFMALGYARELGAPDDNRRATLPITIRLLCDGMPNGGAYSAGDVRPLLEEARARGVRFKLVALTVLKYWRTMWQFGQSLGLTDEELEVVSFDDGTSAGQTVDTGFDLLSTC